MIMDYAETRAGLQDLVKQLQWWPARVNLRVLLLARSAGEWWEHLQRACPDPVSDLLAANPVRLGTVTTLAEPQQVYAQAVEAFARRRGSPAPIPRCSSRTRILLCW